MNNQLFELVTYEIELSIINNGQIIKDYSWETITTFKEIRSWLKEHLDNNSTKIEISALYRSNKLNTSVDVLRTIIYWKTHIADWDTKLAGITDKR